jgi:hypothetical protein
MRLKSLISKLFVETLNFTDYNSNGIMGITKKNKDSFEKQKNPHLIYIGKKNKFLNFF